MRAAAEQKFDAWRAALAWQRRIDAALRPLGLTHSRFLVLDAAAELHEEHKDAVAQREIAERAGFDKTTTSRRTASTRGSGASSSPEKATTC